MSFSLDFNGSTPLQLPPEALNAAAPLRGCALMQTANAHDRLLMLALYLKQQASLREVLVRTFPLRETRWSSPGKPRASSKRVLSGVNAAVVVRSQEAQEIREWILGLSEPVAGSFAWGVPIRTIRVTKRKPPNDELEGGHSRKRVLPAQPTPPPDHPHELAKQCRRLYAATVSIERWNEHGKVRTSVVARDIHGDVRMTFSLNKGRRTSIVNGPGSADFGVAIKGDRRGPAWQAIIFRLESADSRQILQVALETMGQEEDRAVADFIVVGAGTAGLVLAARLSETQGVKVLVLEAGGDYTLDPLMNAVVSIPGLDAQGAGADVTAAANILEIDWGFTTVPRESFGNREIHYERGKTLGGSSTRNFMIYQRGTASTYDAWAALGNKGWDWKGLKPYFDKSVNYLAPDNTLRRLAHPTPPDHAFTGCSSSHEKRQIPVNSTSVITVPTITATSPLASGTVSSGPPQPTSSSTIYGAGPVSLSVSPFPQAFGPYMIGAMMELGFPEATSFNDGVLRGVQFVTSTIQQALRKVARTTSRSSYLLQAETAGREASSPDAGQLVVLTRALVKRIIFEEGTTKAVGVVLVTSEGATSSDASADAIAPGVETELYANKEVLISAGAFQSPQLLMVSGVGPREALEKLGIDVVVDLAGVGQGMEDHILNGITYPVSVETVSGLASNVTFQNSQLANFTLNGLGPFTNPISDMIGFERLSDSTLQIIGAEALLDVVPDDWPHLEYMISPGFMGNFSNLMEADNAPLEPVGQQYASILSALAAPQSRGTITLASSDMADHPIIDPGWLTSPIDQAIAVAGFRRLRQFFATSFMGQILEGEEVFPGTNISTDSEILHFVRHNSMTVWHASCTCSMKPRSMGGVLDARLRVHGTTGLRVVDASSFPSLPPGHPQSTVYALAEKASDLIKEDTRCD